MIRPLIFFICTLLIISCDNGKELQITNAQHYDKYLNTVAPKTTSKYFELWNTKIKPDSLQLSSFGIVAVQYNSYFQSTGNIIYLKKAEQALEKAVEIAAIGKADYYRALARNYISQHRFKEALDLAHAARRMGSGLKNTKNLLFDVHMELGNYHRAERYLDSIKDMADFGYLIRLAKWNDHKGNLETTIRLMEKAKVKAIDAKNTELMLWSYTNLADYYGHAGKIRASYDHYLKALSLDPLNAYAKKGIAWIVFSYEKNPKEALRILDSITKNHRAPDYFLMKAEIAEYMEDDREKMNNLDRYFNIVKDPAYGDMYNAQNAALYLTETMQYDRAMELAKREVNNRPTPEAYSLLAKVYYKMGHLEKAVEISDTQIHGKTFEPAILLQVAEIYKSAARTQQLQSLKSALSDAAYELGPAYEQQIKKL